MEETSPPQPQKPHMLIRAVRHKSEFIRFFQVVYFIMGTLLVLFAYWTSIGDNVLLKYQIGVNSGRIAIVLFCLTILPGILRRFGVRHPIVAFLTSIRRHLGISTFVFGFVHASFLMLFSVLFAGVSLLTSLPLFQIFGLLALYTMTILFFTSNDWSIRHLGPWWKRIHMLVYVIAWFLFAHVILQRVSVWSVMMGAFAVLETVSLLYFYVLKRRS